MVRRLTWPCLMASSTKWTWIWANSKRQWRTGKPDMQSTRSLGVGHSLVTDQQHNNSVYIHIYWCFFLVFLLFERHLYAPLCKVSINSHTQQGDIKVSVFLFPLFSTFKSLRDLVLIFMNGCSVSISIYFFFNYQNHLLNNYTFSMILNKARSSVWYML